MLIGQGQLDRRSRSCRRHCRGAGPKVVRLQRRAAMTAFIYLAAAMAEIAGGFAFWAWLRLGKSAW